MVGGLAAGVLWVLGVIAAGAAFGAESCLTRDTVPVDVDAIAFWVVYDAERAALEVQTYRHAAVLAAQTALRDAIGKHDLAELIQSRKELGEGLKDALDRKMRDWGIRVESVEIRDVTIPQALEDAMSRQAQAERERPVWPWRRTGRRARRRQRARRWRQPRHPPRHRAVLRLAVRRGAVVGAGSEADVHGRGSWSQMVPAAKRRLGRSDTCLWLGDAVKCLGRLPVFSLRTGERRLPTRPWTRMWRRDRESL